MLEFAPPSARESLFFLLAADFVQLQTENCYKAIEMSVELERGHLRGNWEDPKERALDGEGE